MLYQPTATRTTTSDRRCARGEHCGNAQPGPDGTNVADWALTDLPYCQRCTTAIGRALGAMPERYVSLRVHIGDKTSVQGDRVGGSREAPTPLRLDIDALIRDMLGILVSWHERVAGAAGLGFPDIPLTRIPRPVRKRDPADHRRDEVAIPAAVSILAPRLELILRMPPWPMVRTLHVRAVRDDRGKVIRNPDGRAVTELRGPVTYTDPDPSGVVRPEGWAEADLDLTGADFGREMFWLAWMSRRLLGETMPPPERLDGIPCKGCDRLAMIVCPEPVYRSECTACGDLLTPPEYQDWVKLYAAWARRQVESGDVEPADYDAYRKVAA